MIDKLFKWLFEIVGRNNKPRILVEPEPIEEMSSDLGRAMQGQLDSLLRQKAFIVADIEYFKKRTGITMQDRRQVKHLYEELDGLNQDIVALEGRFTKFKSDTS